MLPRSILKCLPYMDNEQIRAAIVLMSRRTGSTHATYNDCYNLDAIKFRYHNITYKYKGRKQLIKYKYAAK